MLEGLAFCESRWSSLGAGITPGALGCRSGFPPIPAETLLENTLIHPSLTVSFRPQASKLFAHAGGRSVLRWYPPGVKLIFHNSLSVPSNQEPNSILLHNSVAKTLPHSTGGHS